MCCLLHIILYHDVLLCVEQDVSLILKADSVFFISLPKMRLLMVRFLYIKSTSRICFVAIYCLLLESP